MPEKMLSSGFKTSNSKCSCCPYGFHIDRDFVRYCDTLYNSSQVEKLRQNRRERRKVKKSLESYLGLGNASFECQTKAATLPHDLLSSDGLKNAVNDFEDTWEKSLKKSSSSSDIQTNRTEFKPLHIQLHTPSNQAEVSQSSSFLSRSLNSEASHKLRSSFNAGVNRNVLSNIREQMAASLKRMRELEEQVKVIPILEVKLYSLREEKKSLLEQVQLMQKNASTTHSPARLDRKEQIAKENESLESLAGTRKSFVNKEIKNDLNSPNMASSLNAKISENQIKKELFLPIKGNSSELNGRQKHVRSVSTSCAVLTRDIGISYVPSKFRSIAVGSEIPFADIVKSYTSKSKYDNFTSVSSESLESDSESLAGSGDHPKFMFHQFSKSPFRETTKTYSQTDALQKQNVVLKKSKFVSVSPSVTNKAVQCSVSKIFKNCGSQTQESKHEKLKSDQLCNLKRFSKMSIGVGDFDVNNISCSNCLKPKKSIGIGDSHVSIPVCVKCKTPESPSRIKNKILKHSTSTCDNCILRQTETVGVGDFDVHQILCENCDTLKSKAFKNIKSISIGTNTIHEHIKDINICDKCSATIHSVAQGFAANFSESKIPRPNIKVPVMNRSNSFKRSNSLKKSKIKMYSKGKLLTDTESTSEDTNVALEDNTVQKSIIKRSSDTENMAKFDDKYEMSSKEADESYVFSDFSNIPTLPHKKVSLSKEVKAACKVLNDSLQRSEPDGEKKRQSSLAIIQTEWFKVANQKHADPMLIEGFLDAFEGFSKLLLHKIVNLADTNGNTALHYAVSYGNFDVVSILIDSKVCDVNKKNKAGYTSIMLVALANVQNEAHNYVVQRLFTIGDINEKATQNGQTALMLAVSHGKKEIVKVLLESGAEINLQDKDGSTALMCAAEHGQLEIVKILLSQPECDPTVVDNDDCNALAIAMDAGHKDIGLLIYANMNFSRGSSPYSTLLKKRSTPRSTPPPRTPVLRTPPLPSPSAWSTASIPSSFQFPT